MTLNKERVLAYFKGCKKSMTIWFNSVMGTAAVVIPVAIQEFPKLQAYLPDDLYKTVTVVLLTGNFLLRFKTTKGLTDK